MLLKLLRLKLLLRRRLLVVVVVVGLDALLPPRRLRFLSALPCCRLPREPPPLPLDHKF